MNLGLLALVLLLHHVWDCAAGRANEPGYIDFDNLPETSFSCKKKVIGGYYADIETGCQMFHVCTIGQKGEVTDIKFLCLNGTVFDQATRVCERVDEVDCSKTEEYYNLNLELYGNTFGGIPSEDEDNEEHVVTEHESLKEESTTAPPPTAPPTTTTTPPPLIHYHTITTHRPLYNSQVKHTPGYAPNHGQNPAGLTTGYVNHAPVHAPRPQSHTSSYANRAPNYHTSTLSYNAYTQPSTTTTRYSSSPQTGLDALLAIRDAYDEVDEGDEEYSSSGDGYQEEEDEDEEPIVIHKPISPAHRFPVTAINSARIKVEHNGDRPINGHSGFKQSLARPNRPTSYRYDSDSTSQDTSNVHAAHKLKTDYILNRQAETEQHRHHGYPNSNSQQYLYTTTTPRYYQSTTPQPFILAPNVQPGNSLKRKLQEEIQNPLFTTPSIAIVSQTSSTSYVSSVSKSSVPNNGTILGISSIASVTQHNPHNLTLDLLEFVQKYVETTPPSSYDEYLEADVGKDPFFKDVPRIGAGKKRARRQAELTSEPPRRPGLSFEAFGPVDRRVNRQRVKPSPLRPRLALHSTQRPDVTEPLPRRPSATEESLSTYRTEPTKTNNPSRPPTVTEPKLNSVRSRKLINLDATQIPLTSFTVDPKVILRGYKEESTTTERPRLPQTPLEAFTVDPKLILLKYKSEITTTERTTVVESSPNPLESFTVDPKSILMKYKQDAVVPSNKGAKRRLPVSPPKLKPKNTSASTTTKRPNSVQPSPSPLESFTVDPKLILQKYLGEITTSSTTATPQVDGSTATVTQRRRKTGARSESAESSAEIPRTRSRQRGGGRNPPIQGQVAQSPPIGEQRRNPPVNEEIQRRNPAAVASSSPSLEKSTQSTPIGDRHHPRTPSISEPQRRRRPVYEDIQRGSPAAAYSSPPSRDKATQIADRPRTPSTGEPPRRNPPVYEEIQLRNVEAASRLPLVNTPSREEATQRTEVGDRYHPRITNTRQSQRVNPPIDEEARVNAPTRARTNPRSRGTLRATSNLQEPPVATTPESHRISSRRRGTTHAPTIPVEETRPVEAVRVDQRRRQPQRRVHDQSAAAQATAERRTSVETEESVAPAAERRQSVDDLPATSFSCADKVPGGYYADLEADCQLFHICSEGRHGRIKDNKFLCGPGTRFNQQSRTCQSKDLVDCRLSASLYHLNNHFNPPVAAEVGTPASSFEARKIARGKRDDHMAASSSLIGYRVKRQTAQSATDDDYVEYYDDDDDIIIDIAKTSPVAKSDPAFQSVPAPRTNTGYSATPASRSAAVDQTAPASRKAPTYDTVPVYNTVPVFNTATASRSAAVDQTAPASRKAQTYDTVPVYNTVPVFNAAPTFKTAAVDQTAPASRKAPTYDTAPVDNTAQVFNSSPASRTVAASTTVQPLSDDEYYYDDDEVIDSVTSSSIPVPISSPLPTSPPTPPPTTPTQPPTSPPVPTSSLGADYYLAKDYVNDNYEPVVYQQQLNATVGNEDDYYYDDEDVPVANTSQVAVTTALDVDKIFFTTEYPETTTFDAGDTTQMLEKLRHAVIDFLSIPDEENDVSTTTSNHGAGEITTSNQGVGEFTTSNQREGELTTPNQREGEVTTPNQSVADITTLNQIAGDSPTEATILQEEVDIPEVTTDAPVQVETTVAPAPTIKVRVPDNIKSKQVRGRGRVRDEAIEQRPRIDLASRRRLAAERRRAYMNRNKLSTSTERSALTTNLVDGEVTRSVIPTIATRLSHRGSTRTTAHAREGDDELSRTDVNASTERSALTTNLVDDEVTRSSNPTVATRLSHRGSTRTTAHAREGDEEVPHFDVRSRSESTTERNLVTKQDNVQTSDGYVSFNVANGKNRQVTLTTKQHEVKSQTSEVPLTTEQAYEVAKDEESPREEVQKGKLTTQAGNELDSTVYSPTSVPHLSTVVATFDDVRSKFDCRGRKLFTYHVDLDDPRLFHYCSPGFHSKQTLDFRFICDQGTRFNEGSQKCL